MPALTTAPHAYVQQAIQRWLEQGLIDPALASVLSAEADVTAGVEQQRQGQLTVAALGAVVLSIAIAVFFAWAWGDLGPVARVMVLIGAGAALFMAGTTVVRRQRWGPVGYGLQVVGTLVLLVAFVYSEQVWEQATRPAQLIGLLSILTPLALARLGVDRSPGTALFAVGFGFAFLYVGIVRATTWSPDTIIWILDAALVGLFVGLWLAADRGRRVLDASELAALNVALLLAMLFVTLTAYGPFAMERWAMLPLDVFVGLVLALCFLGLRLDDSPVPHQWLNGMIASCALLTVPLAFWTLIGGFRMEYQGVTVLVAALGGAWIVAALRRRGIPELLQVGALAVIAAAWYFSVQAGGALLPSLALAFTAAVLFWVSTRLSRA